MAPKKKEGKFAKKNTKQVVSYNSTMPKTKQKEATKARPVVITLVVLCVCVGIAACLFFMNTLGITINLPGRTIAAGVNIAGVDVGGLKKSEAIEAVTAAVGDSYSTETLVVTVMDQQLEITPSVSGASFDVEEAVADAFKYGTESNPETQVDIIPYLALNTQGIQNQIDAIAVNFPTEGIATGNQVITQTIDGEEREVLELTIGTEYYCFEADVLYETILNAYNSHRFVADYTFDRITAATLDLEAIYAEHCYEVVEATLDKETLEVTQSSNGYRFDLEGAKEALAAANPGDVLTFPFEDVLPAMDTETLKSMLFRDVLGTYTASQSSSSNRATNLRLACEALDGIILYPGDVFDYNDALGERTAAKGYKPAASYQGNETVQTYGGGICQPSSCLYYSALIADLEIVQRTNHRFVSSYVPMGMDATVSWGGPEFKFKNNTDFPIRIDATAKGGTVTISLVGTDTKDYYVKMEYEVLGVSYPQVIEKEIKPGSGHKDGEVETTAYTGYTVQTYKLKYDKETDELISREKEAYSSYAKRDKVVYRAKAEETKPTETTPTETKPTEPKPTETKPAETQPTETKPAETQPPEPKPEEPKPTEPQPTAPSVGEAGSDTKLPGEE